MVPDALLLPRQSAGCVPCDNPAPCSCAANEQCVQILRTCDTCGTNQCQAIPSSSTGSGHGIAAGAVAGAVVAAVVGLVIVVLLFLWYRRRARLRRASEEPEVKDAPASADMVLNRPDPNEKPGQAALAAAAAAAAAQGDASASRSTINLDPEAQNARAAGSGTAGPSARPGVRSSVQSNPFTDTHSIQSASTGMHSNVIPIALVPPGSIHSLNSAVPSTQATSGTGPARPGWSPNLDINLDHANVSDDSVRTGNRYARSTTSGITNARNSYQTTGSFASDFLNEAPVIITPTTRSVKQVVGLVKAEVVRTPPGGTSPSMYSSGGLTPASTVRTPGRSPLAGGSFGPSDALGHIAEDEDHVQQVSTHGNPFGDEHSPYPSQDLAPSTIATYGDSEENWDTQAPRRPESFMTQAGSIISAEFGTASRVHLGLDKLSPSQATQQTMHASPRMLGVPSASDVPHTPISAALSMGTPRTPHRMTSAKLVAPQTSDDSPIRGALELQQRRAFEELDTRMSRSSVISSTSTRADSILEGFPFVPPSPISDRPIRTPPRSPLAQHAFNNARANGASSKGASTPATPTTATPTTATETTVATPDSPLPPPPSRKQLGMSTASQSSTMSNGLGSFPFQIDSGNGPVAADGAPSSPPASFLGRQRASLDTLALTADLSSYPLGFDKAAMENYPGPPRRS